MSVINRKWSSSVAVSRYTFQSVNLKRFAVLMLTVTILGGCVYALHREQVKKNATAMLVAAQNTRSNGNLTECLALYERYLNFKPKDIAVMAEYVNVLDELVKGQPNRRREYFNAYERLITMDPSRLDDRRKLIDRYMNRIDATAFTRATGHLEALLKADPNAVKDPKIMEQYALCAERLGQTPQAIERYRVAFETGTASSEVYLRLAILVQTSGGSNGLIESKKLLDRLIKDKPEDPSARLALAKYYLAKQERPQAINELQTALRVNREAAKSQELVRLLAEMYREDNNFAAARDVIALAVAANPADIRLRLILSDLLMKLNDRPGADQQLRDALKGLPPEDALAIDVLDRMIDRHDREFSVSVLSEIRERYTGKPNKQAFADYLQGKLALANGDWPDALTKLTRALTSFEKMPRILAKTHEALGQAHKMANNPERMWASYTAALAADPLLDSAKLGLAEANVRLGRGAEAMATFKAFADTTPEARELLVRLALEEQLAKPSDRRNWNAFEDALGRPPLAAGLEVLNAAAQRAQGRKDDAVATLKSLAAKQPQALPVQLAMVTLQSETDTKAALATIAELETKFGDKVELRLAKANVMAHAAEKPKLADLAAIADDVAMFNANERYALFMSLGDLMQSQLRQPAEAVAFYRKAIEAKPADIVARTVAVDLYLSLNSLQEADAIIEELRKLEGIEGPSYLFSWSLRGLTNLKPNETGKLDSFRKSLAVVLNARPMWGRATLLAAELDDAATDTDAALDKFRRAFALGERQPKTIQRLVALLVARRRLDEARRVLSDAEKSVGLNDELRRQGSLLEAANDRPGPSAEKIVQAAGSSKNAVDHLFRGQWYLLSHKAKDAVTAFEKALEIDKTSPDAWLGLVLAQTTIGNDEAATATAERAKLALANLDKPTQSRVLGLIREILGDYTGAEQQYKAGLAAAPNDAAMLSQLALLYQRLNRAVDAAAVFKTVLASNVPDTLKKHARREIAYSLVARPDGAKKLNDALTLLAENTPPNAVPTPDDQRMKGLLLSVDPYRRSESRKLINEAAMLSSPGQDDALRLVDCYLRDNDLVKAEETLRDAVHGSTVIPAPLLGTLHRLQMTLKREGDAKTTLERMLTLAPKSWETAVAQARLQVSVGDKAAAAKLLLEHPLMNDPAKKLEYVVGALQDLGCTVEAEQALKAIIETSQVPNRHVSMVVFLIANHRSLDAVRAALALPDRDYPPPLKARVLSNAIASTYRAALPPFDQPTWDKLLEDVAKWLSPQLAKPDEMLWMLDGVITDARGQFDAAIESFTKALAANPNLEMAVNNLAYLLAITGKDAAKAEALTTALITAIGPRAHLLDTRAAARIALGMGTEAVQDAEAAVALMPTKPVYWYRLSQARDKSSDISARDVSFRKSIDLGLKRETLHPLEWPAFDKMKAVPFGRN
ncbi:hypothetical protein BH11PLA2_BH11PLA2_23810 [soil metagenome]